MTIFDKYFTKIFFFKNFLCFHQKYAVWFIQNHSIIRIYMAIYYEYRTVSHIIKMFEASLALIKMFCENFYKCFLGRCI